ncbi:hypothetical protein H8959_011165 [Pygathrix nigripes]
MIALAYFFSFARRPVLMMCVVLTTLPCLTFSIAVTEVQKSINGSADVLPDMLPDLPVSLVLLSLIVVDIIEKLRIYPLRGSQKTSSSLDFTLDETNIIYNAWIYGHSYSILTIFIPSYKTFIFV